MQRTSKYLTLNTDYQRFLFDVLANPSTPYPDDFLEPGIVQMFKLIRSETKQIVNCTFEDVDSEFLELRYYASSEESEMVKRLRLENDDFKRPDSETFELSFKHKNSFLSNASEQLINDFEEPSLSKLKQLSQESNTWHSSPILLSTGNHRKNKTYSITRTISIFEEIALVYLQLVNLLIGVQKNNLSKLAVYGYLWRKYVLSVIELDQTFASLNECINEIMQSRVPDYPSHPNYSIWRLLVTSPHRRSDTGTSSCISPTGESSRASFSRTSESRG